MDYIVNALSLVVSIFTRFFAMCRTFFQSIIDFFSNIGNIFTTLWFGIKTILSGTRSLIVEIFNGDLFTYLYSGFNTLSNFVGFSGALFISSILFVVMIRMCIGFVFKMFRLNVDYKTMKTKWNK